MSLLVISSCTGEKDVRDCPALLTEEDFDDTDRLREREAELATWNLPAARLYTGWQHRYTMRGVQLLRERFAPSACTLRIISAGYGLVTEEQPLVPYEATFKGKPRHWIQTRAVHLGIPKAVRDAVAGFSLVIFLLGKEYLLSLNLPIQPRDDQRFVFLSSNTNLSLAGRRTTVVPAGKPETRFGAGTVALKGRMFHLLTLGLVNDEPAWNALLEDETPSTALRLIEAGMGYE